MRLNRRELAKLIELFDQLQLTQDYDSVILNQENSSGIGSVLTATFSISHLTIPGEFTVTISDEKDW